MARAPGAGPQPAQHLEGERLGARAGRRRAAASTSLSERPARTACSASAVCSSRVERGKEGVFTRRVYRPAPLPSPRQGHEARRGGHNCALPQLRGHRGTSHVRQEPTAPHLFRSEAELAAAAAASDTHPLPPGRRRPPLPRQRQHRRLHRGRRAGRSCRPRSQAKMHEVLQGAGDRHRQRPQHRRRPAKRVAKMFLERGVPRAATQPMPRGHRVPQRRAPERADDRRPDHRAQRLLALTCAPSWARCGSASCRTSTRT